MRILTALVLLFLFTAWSYSEEYSFDVEEYEEQIYEINGNIKVNPVVIYSNRDSKLFRLKYYNSEYDDNFSDMYYFIPELFVKLNYEKLSFNAGGNAKVYNVDNKWDYEKTLYECSLNFSPWNLSFDLGRKSLIWGKGYIWNPVSYAGRQKNVDDVEAALEGYWLFNMQWVKSFESALQNLAVNFVVLPSYKKINKDYENIFTDFENLDYENEYYETTHFITKIYALILNTDFDIYVLLNHKNSNKYGADFSKNLLANWEIHFEYSYESKYTKYYLDENGTLADKNQRINNYLAGTRYLTDNEITFIFEYLHNAGGFTKDETDIFYDEIDAALESGAAVPYYKKSALFLNRQFVSKDYLYLKISKPQPFDILYFTPAIFSVYNITDKSLTSSAEFKYTGIDDLEISLKGSYLYGPSSSQYGEKISGQKYYLHLRYYF
ncbi:MAG: hypothetical protein JW864_01435 [Spirochaetes bacterium]|nr:hypothetical protein [Spirochaetota bacterium]